MASEALLVDAVAGADAQTYVLVARRARLGQKTKGIMRIYDHVTPAMLRDHRGTGSKIDFIAV